MDWKKMQNTGISEYDKFVLALCPEDKEIEDVFPSENLFLVFLSGINLMFKKE